MTKYYKDYLLAQVYKTGEKPIGVFSRRGPKPLGWSVYRKDSGILKGYTPNNYGLYIPLLTIDGKLVGEDI